MAIPWWEICALAACYASYRLGKFSGELKMVMMIMNISPEVFGISADQFQAKIKAATAKLKAKKLKAKT